MSLLKPLVRNRSILLRNCYSFLKKDNLYHKKLTLNSRSAYLEFEIKLNFTFEQGRKYQYSKLYFKFFEHEHYDESRVICFHPIKRGLFETVRLVLPDSAHENGVIFIRLDALPYSLGESSVRNLKVVQEDKDPLNQVAHWHANRQQTRAMVVQSEQISAGKLEHYPESISLELTARCNLQCPHCSSHGMPELHKHHNQLNEISISDFERIAYETFPHITALSLVGRGEPTMVSHKLWQRLSELVQQFGVKISCVTNGHFIKQRFTQDLIPYVDELCISMDGNSQESHGFNRGGSQIEKVLSNIEYFHQLRQDASLARRPKISIYWTLMTNNLHELPDFIKRAKKYSPDYFAIRHLVVFHDKDRERSVLAEAEKVNYYLKQAYAELDRQGIEFEGPPLMDESDRQLSISENIIARVPVVQESTYVQSNEQASQEILCNSYEDLDEGYLAEHCTWMYRTGIISYNGEVTTCGKHYGELVGQLNEHADFDSVWNGNAMQSLRTTFNTPNMWRQCRECWLRELRWHAQRHESETKDSVRYQPSHYTQAAWDYRSYEKL